MDKKLRFVNKVGERNIGFSNDEINILTQKLNIRNENFISYLKNAGKVSNVFQANFENVESYIEMQNDFRSIINIDPDINIDSNNLCWFEFTKDHFHNKYFHFIKIDDPLTNPKVHIYSSGEVHIGVNFRDERTEKIGMSQLKTDFVTYVNKYTDYKYGKKWWKKILGYFFLTLFLPLWLPILLYLKFNKRF